MNSRIEQFVRDHREDFDSEEPDKKIWEKIAADLEPRKKKQGILVRFGRAAWIAAAAASGNTTIPATPADIPTAIPTPPFTSPPKNFRRATHSFISIRPSIEMHSRAAIIRRPKSTSDQ